MRSEELARLDRAKEAIRGKVEQGDVRAAEVFTKLIEREARITGCFDGPPVVDPDDIERAIQELRDELNRRRNR